MKHCQCTLHKHFLPDLSNVSRHLKASREKAEDLANQDKARAAVRSSD